MHSPTQHPTMAHTTNEEAEQTSDRKLVVTVPEDLLISLRTSCAAKANVSLLGRIQGKHPGLKALTAWARDTLHPSFTFLSLKAHNVFEVTFANPEGRIHALTQTELTCEMSTISLSSWKPHFDAKTTRVEDQLDFPVWVQIVDLCQILREETFLRTVGEQIGQVIAIDNSDAYMAKLFGPRIRLLIRDLNTIPHTVILPRLDGEGVVEYALEYSGMPNQCGRCRSREHQVRHCPKKEHKGRRKDQPPSPSGRSGAEFQPGNAVEEQPPQENPDTPNESELPTTPITTNKQHPSPQPSCDTDKIDAIPIELQPNDANFPQLCSPATGTAKNPPTLPEPNTPTFVWKTKLAAENPTTGKDKEKIKTTTAESTPLTRQGYRSRRLAEDFWTAIEVPNTPQSARKKLRVIPLLTKNQDQEEYLTTNNARATQITAPIQIAEILAGLPWTKNRARQHIVNEVTQTLHKFLIFNNPNTTPFHKWSQGRWYAQWTTETEGEHTCTLYVSVAVPEAKVKI